MGIKLNRFCHCCTLRTGSLVIGTLGWVFVFGQILNLIQTQNAVSSYPEDEEAMSYSKYTKNIYAQIGYIIGSALVSTLLVYGVYKANRGFILPWLVYKAVEIGIISIFAVLLFIVGCMGHGIAFVLFLVVAALTALHFYFWLCVWCHYKEIGESNQVIAPPAYTTPGDAVCPPKYADEMKYNPV